MADDPGYPLNDDLAQRALSPLAERYNLREPLIVDRTEATHPETGSRLTRFTAVAREEPNGPHFDIILDEEGEPRDEPDLAKLFEPVLTTEPPPELKPGAPVTVDPATNDLSLNPGDHLAETVTVTIPAGASAPRADVYFLADTTGSMGGILNAVQNGANAILTTLGGLGVDLAYGVGNYRDFPLDAYAFQHQLAPTGVAATVSAAIGAWTADGGGDLPEGQLFALHQLAQTPGGSIGWRPGSRRIIVWIGDAPGHEPICPAISGLAQSLTEASVTARLTAENIAVIAISTANPGLDGNPALGTDYVSDCGPPGGNPGQASNIAAATGGAFVSGIQPANVVATITNLLTTAVGSINNVNLQPSGAIGPFVVSIDPPGGYGPLDKDEQHTLQFRVKWAGAVPCGEEDQFFGGALDVVADGVTVASKPVRIRVPACKREFIYSVKFVCGAQDGDCDHCSPLAPGRYATEINVHNVTSREVKVEKRVIPLLLAGAATGREPRSAGPQVRDRIVLPPHTATMDDCCRLSELLFGAQTKAGPNVGILEIIASDELAVTAVYTVSAPGGGVSIDVEEIRPHR